MMKTLLLLGMYFFCHIRVTKNIAKHDNIVEIPPEIYKRMLYITNIFISSGKLDKVSATYFIKVSVLKDIYSEKRYMYVASDVNGIGDYLIGYYILENI